MHHDLVVRARLAKRPAPVVVQAAAVVRRRHPFRRQSICGGRVGAEDGVSDPPRSRARARARPHPLRPAPLRPAQRQRRTVEPTRQRQLARRAAVGGRARGGLIAQHAERGQLPPRSLFALTRESAHRFTQEAPRTVGSRGDCHLQARPRVGNGLRLAQPLGRGERPRRVAAAAALVAESLVLWRRVLLRRVDDCGERLLEARLALRLDVGGGSGGVQRHDRRR
mmetsp:Transcript_30721/g.108036  ORF Transcript_30721/g.108036 Transcript_30721/m.108036 type:complete len:224 (-) Transcript_30721:486-1157(-)